MAGEKQRFRTASACGRKRTGILVNGEILYAEDFIQHIALDVVESYSEIDKGEKKREETNIDLQMDVLTSLSNALKSLGTLY